MIPFWKLRLTNFLKNDIQSQKIVMTSASSLDKMKRSKAFCTLSGPCLHRQPGRSSSMMQQA